MFTKAICNVVEIISSRHSIWLDKVFTKFHEHYTIYDHYLEKTSPLSQRNYRTCINIMNSQPFNITITQNNNQITLGQQDVADLFQHLYHSSRVWQNTYFLGHHILKCPLDLWIYQEMIFELKPDIIIETGTFHGASALYLAALCDIVGNGEIITIDIDFVPNRPQHPRITHLLGSSTASNIVEQVKNRVAGKQTVLVILDSDHSKAHVDEEMRIYNEFVTVGSYLIVEDSIVNGHPVRPEFGPGPMESLEEFLKTNVHFTIDKNREKFFMTQNVNGYLKRIS